MKFLKNWKLIVAAMTVAMFTACAGSNGGSDDEISGSDDTPAATAQKKKEAPKEVIDQNKLKKTEGEATAITEDNHKLRKEIFDAKNKLGISTAPTEEEAAE